MSTPENIQLSLTRERTVVSALNAAKSQDPTVVALNAAHVAEIALWFRDVAAAGGMGETAQGTVLSS